MTLYGHNQTLLKEPGEWVAAGDTVALSGSSGGRASPGLYFAIRHRGRPLNPEQWCRRKVSGSRVPLAPIPCGNARFCQTASGRSFAPHESDPFSNDIHMKNRFQLYLVLTLAWSPVSRLAASVPRSPRKIKRVRSCR